MNNETNSEYYDVVIVGAGISGLGAACHLQRLCPDKSYLILEGREEIGGTWDLFRYPGIRSDSDLYTFGYDFKPWYGQPIATAEEIMGYLHEVLEENALSSKIKYKHWVKSADWSSEEACWSIVCDGPDKEAKKFRSNFLFMCQGYYNYSEGYKPEFLGEEDFEGVVVHPQAWPDNLQYKDKKMVVIGSGATAATIVPAVAAEVEHVIQLQRSPTYYLAMDNSIEDESIEELRALDIPKEWIHEIKKRKQLAFGKEINYRALNEPDAVKEELISAAAEMLPKDFDIDKHLTPNYGPWKERLCLLPDGDMFAAISSGKASIVTDEIEKFVKNGIELKSGNFIEADIVVSATGIELCGLGDVQFRVDDKKVALSDSWTYKGIMISDLPNLAWSFGYIRSSWTLRSDMIAKFVCRLLAHLDQVGAKRCTPRLRKEDFGMNGKAFIDPEDFGPGYMRRGTTRLPKQGSHEPWTNIQDYYVESESIPQSSFDDGVLVFDNPQDEKAA